MKSTNNIGTVALLALITLASSAFGAELKQTPMDLKQFGTDPVKTAERFKDEKEFKVRVDGIRKLVWALEPAGIFYTTKTPEGVTLRCQTNIYKRFIDTKIPETYWSTQLKSVEPPTLILRLPIR